MEVAMLIVGGMLAVVFMANVHCGLRCLRYTYKSSHPPAPPEPKPKEMAEAVG